MRFFEGKRIPLSALALLMITVGCAKNNGTTNPPPPPPPSQTQTQSFSGTVPVGGSDFHTFDLSQTDDLVITLSASNPSGILMGVALGIPFNSGCSILPGTSVTATAGPGAVLAGSAQAGSYCVVVYDAGNQSDSVDYTVTVAITPSSVSQAASFVPRITAPVLPAITVPSPTETRGQFLSSGQPYTITSPQAPDAYTPLLSNEGLRALSQMRGMNARGTYKDLTIQDIIRPHGDLTVNTQTTNSH